MATGTNSELLVHGFIRVFNAENNKNNCNKLILNTIPNEIMDLCFTLFNEEFCWNLSITDLSSMKPRECITSSPIIYNDDLSFHCKVYSSSKGFRKIRLHLLSMNNNIIKHCIVSSSLYCDQINAYSRQVYKYCPDSNKTKHSIRMKNCHDIIDNNQLTIRCNIYSVEITYNDELNMDKLYFPGNILSNKDHYLQSQVEFTWNVSNKLIKSFKTCGYGESYFSPLFNKYWNILCTPNGATYRVEGKFQIGLQIVKWPKNIKLMKIEFYINGTFDSEPKQYEKLFDIETNQTEFYCQKNTFDVNKINHQLSFNVKIKILEIYDYYNQIVSNTKWNQYGIINDNIVQ